MPDGCTLQKRLIAVQQWRLDRQAARYPSEWLALLSPYWQELGWPGQRKLDAIEQQQLEQFHRVCEQWIRLDDLAGKISFATALQQLQSLCCKPVSAHGNNVLPVHVFDVLDGSSLHYDAAWICGMSEQDWPLRPTPHPMLPLALQLEQRMPHSSVEREQHYGAQVTRDLLNCAPELVVSYVERVEETPLKISHYFSGLPQQAVVDHTPHPYLEQIASQHRYELLHDAQGAAFTDTRARGGHSILKSQAQNPADAFARHRLLANELAEPVAGLPAVERGKLIHAALQAFWNKTGSHAALLALDHTALGQRIDDCIEYALRQNRHPALDNGIFRQIEKNRLEKHMLRWMTCEKHRQPFTVVASEKRITYVLNGIELELTIDRIDRLGDDSLLLVDYKTGSVVPGVASWTDERPAEPQLPLYSIATENSRAIAFAQVSSDAMKWAGYGAVDDAMITGKNLQRSISIEAWQQQQAAWQHILHMLMEEFKTGVARVEYHQDTVPTHAEAFLAFNRWPERDYIASLLHANTAGENR